MPKRKSELHLQTTTKSRKERGMGQHVLGSKESSRQQMLKKKAYVRVQQRHPKKTVYLPLQDKANSGVTSSMRDNDLEDSEVFPSPFLPSSSRIQQTLLSLHREDEFELPTSSSARVCARENPGCGRPQHRGRRRPRGHGRGGMVGRGGANAAGGDGGGDGDNDAGNNNGQQRGAGARGPGRQSRPSGRRCSRDRQGDGGNNGGGGGGGPHDDNIDNKPECRDRDRFRLHNIGRRPIAANEPERFSLGAMGQRCEHCGALYFVGEVFSRCMGGNVTIPALPPLPNYLVALYTLNNAHSRNFRNHIRLYMFTFASMNYDLCLPLGNHNTVF